MIPGRIGVGNVDQDSTSAAAARLLQRTRKRSAPLKNGIEAVETLAAPLYNAV